MKLEEKVIRRFQELIDKETAIMQTQKSGGGERVTETRRGGFRDSTTSYTTSKFNKVDYNLVEQWGISCLHLLRRIFGEDGDHYLEFKKLSNSFATSKNYTPVTLAFSVMKSAKDDYENGFLFDTRTLIEAEIFDDLLEQSEELLKNGYFLASAVIAGSVIEDALRKLCIKNNITLSAKPKLDSMNSELAKANVYNLLKQKKITALADLRNKAAHNLGGFTDKDVEDMIRDVRRFMEDYFS